MIVRNTAPFAANQTQPHRLSAFNSHSQSSLDCFNGNTSTVQNSQRNPPAFQHQILQPNSSQQAQPPNPNLMIPRPVSCMSSLNTINGPSQQQSAANDKFAERLNAMLLNNDLQQPFHISQSAQQLQSNLINNQFDYRNSFDGLNINRSYSNLGNNSNSRQSMSDFNSQVQELSFRNVEAQQRLKQLQLEQKQGSFPSNDMHHAKQQQMNGGSMDQSDQKQRDALEKLKKEQRLLKEQIGMLNRERETAQIELDALVHHNPNLNDENSTVNGSVKNGSKNEKNIQSAIMKHMNEINMNEIHNNYDLLSTNTPSLSPIRPEKNV
jgi:hypothetical protein